MQGLWYWSTLNESHSPLLWWICPTAGVPTTTTSHFLSQSISLCGPRSHRETALKNVMDNGLQNSRVLMLLTQRLRSCTVCSVRTKPSTLPDFWRGAGVRCFQIVLYNNNNKNAAWLHLYFSYRHMFSVALEREKTRSCCTLMSHL